MSLGPFVVWLDTSEFSLPCTDPMRLNSLCNDRHTSISACHTITWIIQDVVQSLNLCLTLQYLHNSMMTVRP